MCLTIWEIFRLQFLAYSDIIRITAQRYLLN